MGTALLTGLYDHQPTAPFGRVTAVTHTSEAATHLQAMFPSEIYPNLAIISSDVTDELLASLKASDVIILAIKSSGLQSLEEDIKAAIRPKLVISLLGGVKVNQIRAFMGLPVPAEIGQSRVVVAIPNLASSVKRSMTVIGASPSTASLSATDKEIVQALFSAVGSFKYVQERDLNTAMVLSAAIPAFAAYFVDAVVEAAASETKNAHHDQVGLEYDSKPVDTGFKKQDLTHMAVKAIEGMVALVLSGEGLSSVIERITTKGGVTNAGIERFNEFELEKSVFHAVRSAVHKADTVSTDIEKMLTRGA